MAAGFAVTLVPVVELKPAAGLQVYVAAPVAVIVVELFIHIDGLFALTTGFATTNTVEVLELTQPLTSVPVTIYVCVDGGFATTVEPVVALRPVEGLHV